MGGGNSTLAQRPPPDKYHIQKVKLGSGTFGTVWRAVNRETQEMVAMKAIDFLVCKQKGMKEQDLQREIDLLRECKGCDNITQLWDTFQDRTTFFLALEYCSGGDFSDKVAERGTSLGEQEACVWMKQILNSIDFLHTKCIIHRDIKPDNFLIGGPVGQTEVLKLADFGLAVKLPSPMMLLKQKCGTPAFMSPEQHKLSTNQGCGYGLPVDIWAAGVCMWVLLHGGVHPFVSNNKLIMQDLMPGKPPFQNSGYFAKSKWSKSSMRLCHAMTSSTVSERPQARTALLDEWFYDVDIQISAALKPKTQGNDSELVRKNEELIEELEHARALKFQDAQTIQELELQVHKAGTSYMPKWIKSLQDGITDVLQEVGIVGPGTTTGTTAASDADLRSRELHRDVEFKEQLIYLQVGSQVNYIRAPGSKLIRTEVRGFNIDDRTYDLKVASHVSPRSLSAPSNEASCWPLGCSVTTDFFMDGTQNVYIHGVICAYHPEDGTYAIDVPTDRIVYHHIPGLRIQPRVRLLAFLKAERNGEIIGSTESCEPNSPHETRRPGRSRGCMGYVRQCMRRKRRAGESRV